MKHILSILVHNQPGVLVRVASMFSRRGFNIDSLAVGTTHDPDYSRITVVVRGDDNILSQVIKQLNKLIEVISVQALNPEKAVRRGMSMIKVHAGDKRNEVFKLAEVFRASVIDVSECTVTLEVTGDEDKITAFTEVLKPYEIMEIVKTGMIGLARGESTIYQQERGMF